MAHHPELTHLQYNSKCEAEGASKFQQVFTTKNNRLGNAIERYEQSGSSQNLAKPIVPVLDLSVICDNNENLNPGKLSS